MPRLHRGLRRRVDRGVDRGIWGRSWGRRGLQVASSEGGGGRGEGVVGRGGRSRQVVLRVEMHWRQRLGMADRGLVQGRGKEG